MPDLKLPKAKIKKSRIFNWVSIFRHERHVQLRRRLFVSVVRRRRFDVVRRRRRRVVAVGFQFDVRARADPAEDDGEDDEAVEEAEDDDLDQFYKTFFP